jgi:type I restriction enzyme S subunit
MKRQKPWRTSKLAEIVRIQNGFAFDSERFGKGEGTPLIRIRDLKIGTKTECFYDGPFDEAYVVRSGDVLIGMDGEFRAYKWAGPDALLNQRVCRLQEFSADVEPDFVLYQLNSHLKEIEDNTPFATVKHLSSRTIAQIEVSLPDRSEQRRVVGQIKDCLNRVEEMQQLREDALMDATSLLDALINELLFEASGPTVRLGDVVSIASALVDPRRQEYREMLHIGGANIVSGTGELLNLQTAADENLISGKFLFTPQDVIYSKIRPKLRKVVRPDFSGLCSADSYPLRPIDDRTHRDFLFYLLLSRKLTDYAVSGSNRAGIPKVNREHLMAFEFTLPKPKVQERIAAKLNESWKAARQIANELADAKEYRVLRESILREAFAGNL